MRLARWTLVMAIGCISLGGCTKARLTSSIVNPAYQQAQLSSVLVAFLSSDINARRQAESALSELDPEFYNPSFFKVPTLTSATWAEELGRAALDFDAILSITPSAASTGGGLTQDARICGLYNPDYSCARWDVIPGGRRVPVLPASFNVQVIAAATGDLIWSAVIETKQPGGVFAGDSLLEYLSTVALSVAEALSNTGLVGR